jgi:magnesium transporter
VIRQALVERYLQYYPREAGAHLESLPPRDIARVLQAVELSARAGVLAGVRPDVAAAVLAQYDDETAGELIGRLDHATASRVLLRAPPAERDRMLSQVADELADELRQLLSYPPDTAGAIMDPQVVMVRPRSTVREALAQVRRAGHKWIARVLVVDDNDRVIGTVPLAELVVAPPRTRLDALMEPPPATVAAMASQSEVSDVLAQHPMGGLPVTDFDGRVIGVIRQGALVRAAESAATAGMQTMVGASKDERALSPATFAIRKRLPWLQVNLATAFLASFVVGLFENTIAQFTALAVLLPVAAGQSGNTGAQALAVTMRGLALREIRAHQWFRVASKELMVGVVNGIAVAVVCGSAVYLWSRSVGLAVVIAGAMVLSMMIAGVAGASVPIVLTKLGQDPASASSIILTTVTDIVGFLSFLGLATLASGVL